MHWKLLLSNRFLCEMVCVPKVTTFSSWGTDQDIDEELVNSSFTGSVAGYVTVKSSQFIRGIYPLMGFISIITEHVTIVFKEKWR